MFWNNIKIALRNLRKNKVYAAINVLGLALGLTVYVFGGLMYDYEKSHDLFFEKAPRIYTIGSELSPDFGMPVSSFSAVYAAVGPLIEAELSDVEAVARTISREFLLSTGDRSFYEFMQFADPDLLRIFNFDYIHGDSRALEDPSGILLTESAAIKYFGDTDVLGKVITFDNEFDFHVAAVVRDVPKNSHFNSSVINDSDLGIVGPLLALNRMSGWDMAGNWSNLSMGNMTYVLLPAALDAGWLQTQIDGIYRRMAPEDVKEDLTGFKVNHIADANTAIWDMIGIPVIEAIALLSFLVLVVACVNYTNLATAQSLGRTREVGMRKTMGATQYQLLRQFLIESLVIAAIAMMIAVAALEMIIPLFNVATGKILTLDYAAILPWLVATTAFVGLFAGLYPAWLITNTSPIEALRDIARKGAKGSKMRSLMIGIQFAISAFMLAIVSIVYMQNERVEESSYEFPRSEIYTLGRLDVAEIRGKLDTLKHELEALPNVDSVSFSSQVPFEQNNTARTLTLTPGDESGEFSLMYLSMSPDFTETYDVEILAGRALSRDISNDRRTDESEVVNVLVNEMALSRLGVATPDEALGVRLYAADPNMTAREFIVVGVVPTQNIVGLMNELKPWFYQYNPADLRMGSVRITGGNIIDTVEQIEEIWERVIPEYPMQGRFLDEVFDDVFDILSAMNAALAVFALLALVLAMIGLFGLAAFMATLRTKEIGVRKVLGASSTQIARLLVWQFSRPVMWALLVALPAASLASSLYLNFFSDRIETQIGILMAAGLIAVGLAWATIAGHAIRIAQANPILALRYE